MSETAQNDASTSRAIAILTVILWVLTSPWTLQAFVPEPYFLSLATSAQRNEYIFVAILSYYWSRSRSASDTGSVGLGFPKHRTCVDVFIGCDCDGRHHTMEIIRCIEWNYVSHTSASQV